MGASNTKPETEDTFINLDESTESQISEESVQFRKEGNELYAAAQNSNFGNSMKRIKLQDAMICYNKAFQKAACSDEKASALKNIALSTYKLFQLHAKDYGEPNYKELLYYAKISLENFEAAYEYKNCKPSVWGTELLEKANMLAEEIIGIFKSEMKFEEAMSNIEACALSLGKLKSLKCYIFKRVVKSRFSVACQNLSERNFQNCLHQLAECTRGVEETLKLYDKNERLFGKPKRLLKDMLQLQEDIFYNKCSAESLQAIYIGDEILDKYLNNEEELNMEMVWVVADKFKEAIILSREKDIEVEAIALSRLGRINYKVLRDRVKAREYFRRSIQLALSLIPRKFDNEAWFREATSNLVELQSATVLVEEERKRKEREPYMKEINEEITKITDITSIEGFHVKIMEMIIFTYETYPPKHKNTDGLKKAKKVDKTGDNFKSEAKKMLKRIIIDYHPDKVDEKKYGLRYKILCEEISKVFNREYSTMKDVN